MKVALVDTTLRDGMHSVAHSFTAHQVGRIASGLDRAGIGLIEVSHGDGLAGSSITYGRAAANDDELIAAAASAVVDAKIAVLLIPGIGTVRDLASACQHGATAVRIATHCTEATVAQQHVPWAREQGLFVLCFLMLSHMAEPARLAEQAVLLEGYGAEVLYVVDSAGALVPSTVRERVAAVRESVTCAVGFHAHNNLGCAVGNTLAAIEAGATWVDGSLCGLGAGAGNAQTEALAAALELEGHETGVDVAALMAVAEEEVTPLMPRPQIITRAALGLGYWGVYSSFQLHAERASEKYGVSLPALLAELGRRQVVGGQEDVIVEVAAQLKSTNQAVATS